MSDNQLIETVSADSLTTLLQDAGCRVNRSEQNAVVQLLSASHHRHRPRGSWPHKSPT